MRYSPDHKAEVRQRIVQDAALRVRGEGLNGAAVAAVMRDTGLTHGGFYKHFASKDDLLVESVREAFHDFAERLVHAAEQSRYCGLQAGSASRLRRLATAHQIRSAA